MQPIIIFGAGEIAELAYFYFKHDSQYNVVAFTVDSKFHSKDTFCGLSVCPFEEVVSKFPPAEYKMFIAVSYANVNKLRETKFFEAKNQGYSLISYVSSKATVWPNLSTGENCFILEDNTIQPFAKIGNNVTLWSGNHIGHHSKIEDNCFLASHIVISGGVTVKKNTFIGVNVTIRDHVIIERNNVIAAGALIVKSTEPDGVYVGTPAKLIKHVNELEKI